MNKFKYKIGVEMTMMPQHWNVENETPTLIKLDRIKDLVHLAGLKPHAMHIDGWGIEAPTPPLRYMSQLEHYYTTMAKIMRSTGLRPHHPKVCSAGGHIHVGPMPLSTMLLVFRDMQNRPYLSWVFNDPDDCDTAQTRDVCPHSSWGAVTTCLPAYLPGEPGDATWADTPYRLPGRRNAAVNYHSEFDTLEFRIFDAPLGWEEQRAHVEFVLRYIEWLEVEHHYGTWPEVYVTTADHVASFSLEESREEFLQLLTALGLSHRPYRRMIEENLEVRYTSGRVRN